MRSISRLAVAASATLLTLTGLSLTAGQALAAPLPTLVGSAPAAAHGPNTITFSYTVTLPAAVDSTVFSTHQAAAVPAAPTAVTIDGAAVPPAQISAPSSVDIAVQTGPTPADGLSAGSHTITFTAPIAASGSASTSSTATLSWTQAGVPGSITSAPVLVEVNQPDLAVVLTPDSGEDQVGLLGTGQDLDLFVDVSNNGYGTPRSSLTITLPAGMTLGSNGVTRDSDGSALVCSAGAGSTAVCDLGLLVRGASDPTLDVDLTTLPHEPVGSTVPVTVSVAPNAGEGTDSNPANDSTGVQVKYTGSARLSYRITPSSPKVVLGHSTKVTLTVHNAGPQTAPGTLGLAIVIGDQFEVTGFTGKTVPIDAGAPAAAMMRRAHLLSAPKATSGSGVPVAAAAGGGTGVLWLVGDIAAGGTVTAVLTLKARALGTARIGLIAVSGAADPNCADAGCMPAMVSLSVVKAAVAAPAPVPAPAGGGSAVGGLANTGASARPAVLGMLFLLVGAGLLFVSRRRAADRR